MAGWPGWLAAGCWLDGEEEEEGFKEFPHARRSGEVGGYLLVGVRDLVARGYFIPGGVSQRGGSGSDVSVSHVVRPGLSWTQVSHL